MKLSAVAFILSIMGLFGKKGAERDERESVYDTDDWGRSSIDMDCPDTRFETGPAELITQAMDDEVPQVTRPKR